jgi:O-6-methylguanine DNA methyltransferase
LWKKQMQPEKPLWLIRLNDTPLGHLDLRFTFNGLAGLEIVDPEDDHSFLIPGLTYCLGSLRTTERIEEAINETLGELIRYFRGAVTSFSKVRLDLQGSVFQLQVWQKLRKIPWGETTTYRELSHRLGRPQAVRSVGQACRANPVPIIIPCHRVIAADGSLGGYRFGLERKRWLLGHEGVKGKWTGA